MKPLTPTATVNTKHSPTSNQTEINPHTNSLCEPVSNTQYKMFIFQEKIQSMKNVRKKNLRRQNSTITRPRYDTDDRPQLKMTMISIFKCLKGKVDRLIFKAER